MELARVAGRQHGLVTTAQLRACGLSDSAITNRLQAGRLHRVLRGVYAVGHARLSPQGRYLAAVLSLGDKAVLSHRSAAALWGLIEDRGGPVDVTVPRRVGPRRGIHVHYTRSLDRTREWGIPVTPVARTLVDLTEVVDERLLRRALRQALVERRVDVRALYAELDGRRAAARLKALLADGPAPTRSELEDRVLALLRDGGLPRPEVNVRVEGYEVDFLYRRQCLVIEADGARYHGNRIAQSDDRAKQARLEAAGYKVLRLTWQDVTAAREQTVRRLRSALARHRAS